MSKFIVTGYAGFIGYHLTKRLLGEGHSVVGIDNYSNINIIALKSYRQEILREWEAKGKLTVHKIDICDSWSLNQLICPCEAIYHLAAIPGVRKSFESPETYVQNNINGSINVLRAAGEYGVGKVILASSSSVYGDEATEGLMLGEKIQGKKFIKCHESYNDSKPLSPYAMTKKAMELAGYTYHKLYGYDVIMPRFFTVYGPAGRPDMAYYIFIKKILADEPIDVYGDGEQVRDFTYIDDIVDGLMGLPGIAGCEVLNFGSGSPLSLNTMIKYICHAVGRLVSINRLETQPGDVQATFADNSKAKELLGWEPKWSLEEGIIKTVEWFRETDLTIFEGAK